MKCATCRRQYTPTVGTELHGLHLKHSRVITAIRAMTESPVAAISLHRAFGWSYGASWKLYDTFYEAAGYAAKLHGNDRGRKDAKKAQRDSRELHASAEGAALYPYAASYDRVEGGDLIALVNETVPRGLNEMIRPDVCQALLVALISLEISVEDISRPETISRFIKAAYREMTAFSPRFISLERPRYGDDGGRSTFGDTLAAP